MKGLDSNQTISPEMAARIKAQGMDFVCRYISPTKKQPLTKQEREDLIAAGLTPIIIFERGGDHAGYYSSAQGVIDGAYVYEYCVNTLQIPAGECIYFAGADYDASQEEVEGIIFDYFRGIRTNWASHDPANSPSAQFLDGNYGSGRACRLLKAAGLVHKTWLAFAPGWGEWDTFTDWDLKQTGNNAIDGLNSDPDETRD